VAPTAVVQCHSHHRPRREGEGEEEEEEEEEEEGEQGEVKQSWLSPSVPGRP